MAGFRTFKGSWPWPWIGSYCIPSCITRWPLPTHQISLKSKKRIVDGRTYGRAGGRTFETHFIRLTRRSSPKNPFMAVALFLQCTDMHDWPLNNVVQLCTPTLPTGVAGVTYPWGIENSAGLPVLEVKVLEFTRDGTRNFCQTWKSCSYSHCSISYTHSLSSISSPVCLLLISWQPT